ncbi:MAG: hypothetical protein MMC33_004655 [Icmadophila ericetorum]|nr:hypothetical protein [Icmadophila ericetorum]
MDALIWLAIFALVLKFLHVIYRLTFHPLARFPGPKLAGATHLYGMYYDLLRAATLVKMLPELHEKYGPIVRIFPNELHIRDMEAFNEVYKSGTKFDKNAEWYSNPFFEGSHITIPDLKTAKQRKDMFQPYFSKAAIQRVEPLLKESTESFLKALRKATSEARMVDLTFGFRCLTADIIMDYCYQKPFGALAAPDFRFPLIVALDKYSQAGQWDKYFLHIFRVIAAVLNSIPPEIAKMILPPMSSIQWMQKANISQSEQSMLADHLKQECGSQIHALKQRPQSAIHPYPTIFDVMLNPNPEKNQYTPSDNDLTAEAILMLAAGMDTSATTLVLGTWHVISQSGVCKKLREELSKAMPERDKVYELAILENLPYLRGVVKESLRLSYGAPGRLPRIVPSGGARFCGRDIPPGTIVSQSSYVYHADERIFADAAKFIPERWLSEDYAKLDRHMVAFSRGSRGCLGVNLAYAELYLTFAHLFRNFDLSPYQTSAADMDWGDYFITVTRGHLKVRLQELDHQKRH